MKYLYMGFGMILLGIFGIAILIVFQNITIGNESDYYDLKEAMRASMIESVDKDFYLYGSSNASDNNIVRYKKDGTYIDCTPPFKINEQKFVANFTKRFAKSYKTNTDGYKIDFYDIMEYPPKATIIINDNVNSRTISSEDFDVKNELSGVIYYDKTSSSSKPLCKIKGVTCTKNSDGTAGDDCYE